VRIETGFGCWLTDQPSVPVPPAPHGKTPNTGEWFERKKRRGMAPHYSEF